MMMMMMMIYWALSHRHILDKSTHTRLGCCSLSYCPKWPYFTSPSLVSRWHHVGAIFSLFWMEVVFVLACALAWIRTINLDRALFPRPMDYLSPRTGLYSDTRLTVHNGLHLKLVKPLSYLQVRTRSLV